jgi:hypothetical protein
LTYAYVCHCPARPDNPSRRHSGLDAPIKSEHDENRKMWNVLADEESFFEGGLETKTEEVKGFGL